MAMSSSYISRARGDDGLLDYGDGGVAGDEGVVEIADASDAPEEIDCGGAGGGEVVADFCDLGVERGDVGGGGTVDADGDAHGAGDTDDHGAAGDHVADDGGDLLVIGGEDVGFFQRKPGLIEEVNAFREPFEGGNHVGLV